MTAAGRPVLVLADNQDLTRAGVEACARRTGYASVVRAADRKELTALLTAAPRAVVVLDYALFDFTGPEHLLIFVNRFPTTQWLLLSAEFGCGLLRLLAAEQRVGFVLKECGEELILHALAEAAHGRKCVCPAVRERLAAPLRQSRETLTATEREVLRLIAAGHPAKDIAELRHSSVHTIVTHKKNIFRKIEVNNVREATRYALRAGIADPIEYYI